ncbi:NAD(P)-binding protein [Peniophora sp. CONT]|nr:NAD(P)-binding protein [Peniophora sp. CONT]
MTIDSRVWLVTGASSGFGRALVEAVLLKGERAVATTRKSASLDELAKTYRNDQLLVLQLDITNTAAITSAFDTVKDHFGRLDVVVNNAGYGLKGEMESTSEELARPLFETLFWGPVNITKHAIRFFREVNPEGSGGFVMQISSLAGYIAPPTFSFYAAAKSALETFTLSAARELPPEWNIRTSIIEPGLFDTNWHSRNMIVAPRHPAYSDKSPSRQFMESYDKLPQIGDVQRAAQAMMTVADAPAPPSRLQLGTDAWGLAHMTAQNTLTEQEKWAALSHSTNSDGYGLEVLDHLEFPA